MKIFRRTILTLVTGLSALTLKAQHPTVTLDYYFNHELRKTPGGALEQFHYTWEDQQNTGYSIWGKEFVKNGAHLKSLPKEPTKTNLKGTDIYIIADPDTKKETLEPHYIEEKDVDVIAGWVKGGGVLVMMANDSANVELPHFNKLAEKFGIHFNDDLYKHVVDDQFDMGALYVKPGDLIFKTAKKLYLKDIATITVTPPARAAFRDNGHVIIAVAHYGKGTVFAVGDPWFYNEYTNGRLPASFKFDNDKAANDVAKWLIKQVPAKR